MMSDAAQAGDDPFDAILEHEDGVQSLGERDDRVGAAARVGLALAREEAPDDDDLNALGLARTQDGEFVWIGGDEA